MKIQVIVGSVRETRTAIHVANWISDALKDHNADVEIVDLKQWNLPFYTGIPPMALNREYTDPIQKNWSEKILEANAFIIISPEYNHGYSPALKNALDFLGTEWQGKPTAFVSYGGTNGVRSIEQIRAVTTQLGLIDLNLTLEIRDIFTRTKEQNFQGSDYEVKSINAIASKLIKVAAQLRD